MKKISFLIGLVGLIFFACDKVKDPIIPQENVQEQIDDVLSKNKGRKILIEDFTGQACGNCPLAAAELDSIIQIFGDSVVVPVTIHAGWFADTSTFSGHTNGIKLATDEGETLDIDFGVSAMGNPNGMVDRRKGSDSSYVQGHGKWRNLVIEYLAQDTLPNFALNLTSAFNENTREFTLQVDGEVLENSQGNFYLTALITEDNIIAPQKFYEGVLGHPAEWVDNYVHKHVLRAYIDNVYGEEVIVSPDSAETFTKTYSLTLPTEWKADNCHAVVFIYNQATKYIYQTEETSIK